MKPLSPLSINLASTPFRAERARNAALGAASVLAVISLAILALLIRGETSRASALHSQIGALEARLLSVQREQGRAQGVLAKPENAGVFSQSVFLNELIARRAVSWSRVFDDLQTVIPYNVRLVSVRLPQAAPSESASTNHLQLDMTVGSDRQDAVVELLKRLEESPLFGYAVLLNQQPPTQNEPLYRYRISVAYVQKF
jgi:type IV pilus assembly protein PilN